MKGSNYFLIFALIVIIFMVLPLLGALFQSGNEISRVLTRDVYIMENALDGGTSYLDSALGYSVYQGCFDVLRKGGFSITPEDRKYNERAVWYSNIIDTTKSDVIDSKKTPSVDSFLKELEKEVSKDMKVYSDYGYIFLRDIPVILPKEYSVDITSKGYLLNIRASSENRMTVSSGSKGEDGIPQDREYKLLNKEIGLEKEVLTSCLEIFDNGRVVGKEFGKGVETAVFNEMNQWEKSGEAERAWPLVLTKGKEQEELGNIVFGEVYKKSLGEVEKEIKARLEKVIGGILPKNSGNFLISLELLKMEVNIEPNCNVVEEKRMIGDEEQSFAKISCKFVYKTRVVGKVTIEDPREERKVPVFDGDEVRMAAYRLEFVDVLNFSIDKEVKLPELKGNYRLLLRVTNTIEQESQILTLLQTGKDVMVKLTPFTGLDYKGKMLNDFFRVENVATIIGTNAVKVSLTGTLKGDVISGDFLGQVVDTLEPVRGSFTATLQS